MTKQMKYYYRNRETICEKMAEYRLRTGRTKTMKKFAPRTCKLCKQEYLPKRREQGLCHAPCTPRTRYGPNGKQRNGQRVRHRSRGRVRVLILGCSTGKECANERHYKTRCGPIRRQRFYRPGLAFGRGGAA